MKLVKLLDKLTPEIIGSTKVGLPEEEKYVLNDNDLLISNDRFTLLKNNHIRMMLIQDFSEVAVANLGNFDKSKTYLIKKRIKPSKFSADIKTALKALKANDYIFVYDKPTAKQPIKPILPKDAELKLMTIDEFDKVMNQYKKDMDAYEKAMIKYKESIDEFIKTEASLKEFGWLIRVVSETQYEVIADFSFETTKTEDQFGALGKLPQEIATKITKALGGFSENDSIKGMSIANILTKALGLTLEEELVGEILPTAEESTGPDPGKDHNSDPKE